MFYPSYKGPASAPLKQTKVPRSLQSSSFVFLFFFVFFHSSSSEFQHLLSVSAECVSRSRSAGSNLVWQPPQEAACSEAVSGWRAGGSWLLKAGRQKKHPPLSVEGGFLTFILSRPLRAGPSLSLSVFPGFNEASKRSCHPTSPPPLLLHQPFILPTLIDLSSSPSLFSSSPFLPARRAGRHRRHHRKGRRERRKHRRHGHREGGHHGGGGGGAGQGHAHAHF